MENTDVVSLSRGEILDALDYLTYIDSRLEHVEDACAELCMRVARLQVWLERVNTV